ncbi:MAG: glutathione S-transferase [Gammaproteobacteria bacterium]|nr:MAG: glutathione S-transferase [Gammaproteobacteria bacterium]
MALKYSAIKIELREIELNNMPQELLSISPNATVPVLTINDATVMDESWDIIKWAVSQNDPENWSGKNNQYIIDTKKLIEINDFSFKENLDHYKYADRFPEHSEIYYREACEVFIAQLETMLSGKKFLLDDKLSLADIAVFPFVRQFSMVNIKHFEQSPFSNVRRWLDNHVHSKLFLKAFTKHAAWKTGDDIVYL